MGKLSIVAVLLLLALASSFALPTGASSVTAGTPVTLTTASAGTASAWGGNITRVDLTINSSTLHWQAFWGSVNGSLILGTNTTDVVKTWTVSNVSGEIYASQSSNVDFTTLNSTSVTLSNMDSAFSFLSGSADSAASTGSNSANPSFLVSQYNVAANTYPLITTQNGSHASTWKEVVLNSGNVSDATKFVFVGILNNSGTSFNNAAANYQIIVPQNNAGTSSVGTYYFYGEINGTGSS